MITIDVPVGLVAHRGLWMPPDAVLLMSQPNGVNFA